MRWVFFLKTKKTLAFIRKCLLIRWWLWRRKALLTVRRKRFIREKLLVDLVLGKKNCMISWTTSLEFAKTFHKRREIYGENKKRFHKNIANIMDKEDRAFIESLQLMV